MRLALLSAALSAALAMSACGGQAAPASLTCPDAGDALTVKLCAALRQEMDRRAARVAGLQLTLQAHSPQPDRLLARLSIGDGPDRRDGPEITLSVMDRPTLPEDQLQELARLLLDQTLSPEK